MKDYIFKIVSIILLFLLCASLFKNCKDNEKSEDRVSAMQDSLHITVNKLGEQTATTKVLVGSNKQLKKDLKNTTDSMYLRIRAIDRYYKRKLVAASAFDIETKDTSSGSTVISAKDTVRKDNVTYIYPEYKTHIEKKFNGRLFASYDITSNKDSTQVISDIKNPIDVDYRYNRKNFFDRKHLVVDIKTYNPNTGVKEAKSIMIQDKKPKLKGILIGIGAIGGFIIRGIFHI